MKLFNILFVVSLVSTLSTAQIQYATDAQYKVEKSSFKPPTQDVINGLEGSQATSFMANDQNNEEILLNNYQGKNVVLWFWEQSTPGLEDMIRTMNMVGMDYEKEVKIISFMTSGRSDMTEFLGSNDVRFSVIPNGGILGEQMYAGSLGFPRMFFIDRSGTIQKVIPSEYFDSEQNMRGMIEDIIHSLNAK